LNLKLNIAHRKIGVVDEQTSHVIEGYKYWMMQCVGSRTFILEGKIIHMMSIGRFINLQLVRKFDSKLNQHCYIILY
jgi:hypothetical protein